MPNSHASVCVTDNKVAANATQPPALSLVVPCYGAEETLAVLLGSLDQQLGSTEEVELVFVIDGSPDRCEEILAEWMDSCRYRMRLAVQDNTGVAGALNTGLRLANGAWITFSGPDDEPSLNYFSEILAMVAAYPHLEMFTTRLVRVTSSGRPAQHPLDFKFAGVEEPRIVNLDNEPEMIQLHAGVSVFKRSRLESIDLWFDERLREGFEDAHFIARYLLALDAPEYLMIPQAHNFYYARPNSITSVPNYAKYINIAKFAYRDILHQVGESCPAWVGSLLLYDMWWLFRQYSNIHSPVFSLNAEQQGLLNDLTRETLQGIGVENIRKYKITNVPLDVRAAWESAAEYGRESHVAVLRDSDPRRKLQKIGFHSAAPKVTATVTLDGRLLDVPFSKARAILLFNRPWMYEHIYWVSISGHEHRLQELVMKSDDPSLCWKFDGRVLSAGEAGRLLDKVPPPSAPSEAPRTSQAPAPNMRDTRRRQSRARRRKKIQRLKFAMAYRFGGLIGWRRRFANAWVMIDRNTQANDNAEALYRYIQHERPDLNPWFVINRDASDYARLKADGFRLVAHHSYKHFCLMKEAKVLASSMIDHYIVRPFPHGYLPKTWAYSFLQHGVTKELLHRWWNAKRVDHVVTTTHPEHASIIANPGPYKLSEREVTLTGMPRHDRLFRLSEESQQSVGTLRRIVIMPTWRNYLMGAANNALREQREGFYETAFVTEWSGFLNGDYIKRLSQQDDVEVILLPHPGIDSHWNDLELPAGIRRISYVGDDVQEVLAATSLVVTDYSSQAFEGAFCGAPTVYFQFDREEFFAGSHIGSPGYFDYFRDGFGPVCESRSHLEESIDLVLNGDHPDLPKYRERIENLYPLRDDRASERVVSEIEKRLVSYDQGVAIHPPSTAV